MTNKTFQYVVAIGSLAVIAGIIIAVNSKKKVKQEELLSGLGSSYSSNIFQDKNEATKMCLPISLKNTIMSLSDLEYLPEPKSFSNTSINPYMNRDTLNYELNKKLKYPQNIREGLFYIQVGSKVLSRRTDGSMYMDTDSSPNKFDLQRKIFDIETKSATTPIDKEIFMPVMFKYAPREKVILRDENDNIVFQTEKDIDLELTNVKVKKIIVPTGCSISLTSNNIILNYIASNQPYILNQPIQVTNVMVVTPNSFDFFLKNFVGNVDGDIEGGNITNIVPVDKKFEGIVFPQNEIFYLIHGNDGTMLHPQESGEGTGLVRADQWTTWETTWRSVKRNEVKFIPTGDKNDSYYIQFVINNRLFNAKDDNVVDFNGNFGSDRAKWLIEFSGEWQSGGVGAYRIKSVLKNLYITWSNQVGASWVTLTSGGSWIGIYNKNNFGWGGYLFGLTSLQEGDNWDDYIPVGGTLVQYARSNNFQHSGYGVDSDNKKYWNRDSEAGSGGNWTNHALLQARKHKPVIPSFLLKTIGTNNEITDDESCRFTVELNDRNQILIRHKQSGLYLSSYAPYLVPKNFALNLDHASCKLVPVLTRERANFFFQASMKYLRDNRTFIPLFCNYGGVLSNKFPDGTLKIGTGENLSENQVTAAFEKICACNMDYQFYQNLFCSDELIKETFGVTDTNQIKTIRGTLKCEIPNCIYPLCQKVYELGEENAVRGIRSAPSQDCGASTVCFSQVTVNNNGTLNNVNLNFKNNQSCGNSIASNITKTYKDPFMWKDPTKKDVIIKDYTCKAGDKDIDKSSSFCVPDPFYDFTKSTQSTSIADKKLVLTISNVSGSFSIEPSSSSTLKAMILEKFNLPGLDYEISVSSQNKSIKITSKNDITCPAPQTMCEYNPTAKKWFSRKMYTRPTDSTLTVDQFNQACASGSDEGCNEKNDCTLGEKTIKQSCSSTTSEEIIEYPITRLPSGSGKSCQEVVSTTLNNASYKLSTIDNNLVRASKICDEDNKWSANCSTDANVNRLVQKITQCIPEGNSRCVDKVCIDWPSGATINSEFIPNLSDSSKGTKKITVNLTYLDASKLNTTEVKNFIKSRLNINDTMEITSNEKQLIVIINYNCGTLDKEYETQCVYENGKWVKKFKNIYKNPTGIDGDNFNQFCKPATLSGQDDCTDSKDCEITLDSGVSNSCVNGKQKIGFSISKNLSGSGKSCLVVAKEQKPDYTFNLDSTNINKIIGEKTCTINNQWEKTCVEDSNNTNRLLNKIKTCLPANNDECKDKICIDWPSESAISTVYEPLANQGKGKKIVTVTMSNADRNLIQSNPEVRTFIQSKLNTTDAVTYTYDGNKLVVTVDYSCGTLEKTYSQDCELLNGNWIKRYSQSYKNPTNIESYKNQALCGLANPSGVESCDVNKNCEISRDTTVDSTCVNKKQRVIYKVDKPSNKTGQSCIDVLKTIEPSVKFTLENGIYVGEKSCSMDVEKVDCQVGNWGECSAPCGGGTRNRPILTNKQGEGADCPPIFESCNTQVCKEEKVPVPDEENNKILIGVIGVMVLIMIGGGAAFAMKKK